MSVWTIAPLSLAAMALLLGHPTWAAHMSDMTGPVRVLTGLLVAASLATAALGSRPAARLRLALVLATMTVVTGVLTLRAVGRWPFWWDGFGSAGYAGFLAITMGAATIGVACAALWARWVALTFALAAIGTGGLNAVWLFDRHDEWSWMPILSVLCGGLLLLGLAHPTMRQRCKRAQATALWSSPDRVVHVSRAAVIANMLAIPMLLVYALVQPIVPATVGSAFGLAPLLALGCTLVLRGKVAGVIGLGVTGLWLAAHTVATLRGSDGATIQTALYYAAFWTPAALLGVVASLLVCWRALANRHQT